MNTNSTSDPDIIYYYDGPCTNKVIQESVDKIRGLFNEEMFDGPGRRLSSAAIEMIQNIGFYSDDKTVVDGELVGIGSFSIVNRSGTFLIETKNRITPDKFAKFDQWVKKLNSSSKEELKQLRKEFLKNGAAHGSRGANIGLLDIVRKNGSPILTGTENINGSIYLIITVKFTEE